MTQLHKLTCIDGVHAAGVQKYLVNEGWGAAICGREVYTDVQDMALLAVSVANGMALLEEAEQQDIEFYAINRE